MEIYLVDSKTQPSNNRGQVDSRVKFSYKFSWLFGTFFFFFFLNENNYGKIEVLLLPFKLMLFLQKTQQCTHWNEENPDVN